MSKSVDKALRECIRMLESGRDIDSVLAAYPDQADDLRAHLSLWTSMAALEKADAPAPVTARGQQRLLTALRGSMSSQAKGGTGMSRFGLFLGGAFAAGVALTLAVVFFSGALGSGSSGTTTASASVQTCISILDLNGDGTLGVDDIAVFKDAIKTQNLAFDYNKDGTVDVFDAEALIQQVVTCLQSQQFPTPTLPPLP